ncbi:endonuclease/exonuclease/phosphatase family protein [Edwardsiella anguillarum]|uniref:endonuclease/exonuclease/phosphatase family protein n=2 Tax=Edwardsiella anguillarum TaxID=1821960 RepID=UPI0002D5A8E0|nr:endonuclease [Edwardsiella anguillarum]KAB0584458.1 endonuclease/exonuclease/phosphatase family protein [Edwardsiella anguillarum]
MEINICWWNIGISPPITTQKKDKSDVFTIALKYIKDISVSRNIDLFAMCEASENESEELKTLANELHLDFIDLSTQIGRVVLDMAIMYESSKLEFISKKNLIHEKPDGTNIRVGVRVTFKESLTEKIITIFLSHWPSKLSTDEHIRESAATSLRNAIDFIFNKYGNDSQILCMGDYNTPPYSNAIKNILSSTRDFHAIKKRPKVLFNPTWCFLSDNNTNNLGTYHLKTGKSERWHVIDQMIFSSSFIHGAKDTLKLDINSFDLQRALANDNKYLDEVLFSNFDHFPIFCKVYHE